MAWSEVAGNLHGGGNIEATRCSHNEPFLVQQAEGLARRDRGRGREEREREVCLCACVSVCLCLCARMLRERESEWDGSGRWKEVRSLRKAEVSVGEKKDSTVVRKKRPHHVDGHFIRNVNGIVHWSTFEVVCHTALSNACHANTHEKK